ncbi:MAG: hypothetical protein HGB18_00335 [Candidatus Moranbacteria bacterium]|nr:hypothetical protein [Candidatus Moranbacteria bacterium]
MTALQTYVRRLLVAMFLLLGGCATVESNTVTLKGDKGNATERVRRDMTIAIDPVAFAGIPYTDDIRNGNFVALLATFPRSDVAYSEYHYFRVSYPCYAVDASGKVYPAHAVFSGYVGARLSATVIVEGTRTVPEDLHIIWLSTRVRKAFTLDGPETTEPLDEKVFRESASYRQSFTMNNGSSARSLSPVKSVDKAIRNWTVFETKSGTIVSPLSIEQIRFLARINPMYSFKEKLIGTGKGGIQISFNPTNDLIMNATQLAFNIGVAAGSKPMGLDYESNVSRLELGRNTLVLEGLMRQQQLKFEFFKQPTKGGQ